MNSSQRPSSSKTAASSVRVLTATARGMEHWSQYKDYTHLLFEVFGMIKCSSNLNPHTRNIHVCSSGVVSSPMSVGSTGAKEFTLKASDGVVKCVRLTHMYILMSYTLLRFHSLVFFSSGFQRCLFWEIDRKLPHLVRGQMHRLVCYNMYTL